MLEHTLPELIMVKLIQQGRALILSHQGCLRKTNHGPTFGRKTTQNSCIRYSVRVAVLISHRVRMATCDEAEDEAIMCSNISFPRGNRPKDEIVQHMAIHCNTQPCSMRYGKSTHTNRRVTETTCHDNYLVVALSTVHIIGTRGCTANMQFRLTNCWMII